MTKTKTKVKAKAKQKTCFYGGKQINILDQKGELVPTKADTIYIPTREKRALAVAIKNSLSALLIGETGTGKTSAVREIAFKTKQLYTRINMNGYSTPDELIGSKGVKGGETFWEHGVLTKAMMEGHICVLDEINATPPDCMFILHGLLDDDKRITLPSGEIITPHKDFKFFATMNRDYEGTKSLNRAFLDRFPIVVEFKYPTVATEEKIVNRELDLTVDEKSKKVNVRDMITVAHLGRKAYKSMKTLTPISTRSLLQWANLISSGISVKDAFVLSVCNKAVGDEQTAFMDFFNSVFKVAPNSNDDDKATIVTLGELRRKDKDISALKNMVTELNNKNGTLTHKVASLSLKLSQGSTLNDTSKEKTYGSDGETLKEALERFRKTNNYGYGTDNSKAIDLKDLPF